MTPATTLSRDEIIARYKGGESVVSIAASFGVCRQRIYQVLGDSVPKDGRSKRKVKAIEDTPYVNLKAWLNRKDTIPYVTFVRSVFGGANTLTISRFRKILEGGEQANLTIGNIRRMEQITGMTFDQIFFKEDTPHDQQRL